MSQNDEMRMSCGQFREVVDDLDRSGTPGPALREAALAHAESCSGCAQLLTDTEALDFALQAIAAHKPALQAPAWVEATLLQQLRVEKAAAQKRRGQWRMVALGAAAVLLLALSLGLRHNLTSGKTGVSPLSAVANPVVGTEPLAENVSADMADSTAFVSLPYAADPATLEGGTVVRVELSRSALASMGMPVADASAADRIPADILLSEDGSPQAIRLVSQANLDN